MSHATCARRRSIAGLGLVLLTILVVSLFGAVGAEASGSSATSARALVGLRTTALGAVLVDARGRTLYLFEKDRKGKSSCTGACAAFWPPLVTVGKPAAGRGVKASLLGTTRRGDGRLQVTYNRHPLYTFSLDKKAGQTKGEELSSFGGSWYAVSAKGVKVEKAESSGGGSYGGGSGGGGYGP